MKINRSSIWIGIGTVLLLVALSIVLYNFYQDNNGNKISNEVVSQIKYKIPTVQYENDVPSMEKEIINQYEETPQETEEEPLLCINGDYYLGIITIPSLNLELPILNNLTNKNLKKSPCQYSGSISTEDLIIAGHNYKSHFGRLQELNSGDEILITDINGVIHIYEVIQSEIISGYDVSSMKLGAEFWDLTLFTCTLSGQSRVTVRAVKK